MAPQDTDNQDQIAAPVEAEVATGVGPMLMATRVRVGEDLRDVAKTLHIRFIYLQAIEDGRYQDLPGAAYALGFIRTYADYLGLDSEEVIRRFKADSSADTNDSSKLIFPVPIPESSVPGGAIVFIGFVIAILAYGGWYASTAKEGFLAELISPLPERLMSLLPDEEKAEPASEPVSVATTEPEAAPEPDPVIAAEPRPEPASEPVEAVTVVEAEQPAAEPVQQKIVQVVEPVVAEQNVIPVEPVAQGGETDEQAAVEPITEEPHSDDVSQPQPEQEHQPVVVAEPGTPVVEPEPLPEPEPVVAAQPEPTPAPQPAAEPSPAPAAMDDAPATAEIPASAEVSEAVEAAAAPITEVATVATSTPTDDGQSRIFGVGDDQFRIEVKALKNSWIQVRDDVANRLILTRLLRVGDIYRVPDRAGLKLLTGNAGALEILVDGNKVPAIGTSGDVRRSVALDPDRLVQGQAVD